MFGLIDGKKGGARPILLRSEGGRPLGTDFEIITHRDKVYLRPLRLAADGPEGKESGWSAGERLRVVVAALLLLAGVVIAYRAFPAGSRGLREGSLATPAEGITLQALVREQDRRREELAAYDHQIAVAEGEPELQSAWRDLKVREAEALERLTEQLDHIRRSHPPPIPAGSNP